MLKTIVTAAALALAGLIAAPAAFADVSVNVNGDGNWYRHHRHHAAVAVKSHSGHGHVYYDGAYAHVSRDNGATIVHAYPGVDVYVGAGGGVSVNVGY